MGSIKVGNFEIPLSSPSGQSISLVPICNVFGRLRSDLKIPCSSVVDSNPPENSATFVEGKSNFENQHKATKGVSSCANCLGPGHDSRNCASPVRCKVCWFYGHRAKKCYKRRPNQSWRPKSPRVKQTNKATNPKSTRADSSPSRCPRSHHCLLLPPQITLPTILAPPRRPWPTSFATHNPKSHVELMWRMDGSTLLEPVLH